VGVYAESRDRTVRILHVEDDKAVAGIVKEMLEYQGWQVETVADGNAALKRIDSEPHYDLLIVDYVLPGVNGLELVRRARHQAQYSQTPIVMLSANPVEAEAREAGADIFLYKPLDVNSLVETVKRLLAEGERNKEAT
jgi:DNA-binding response OmpR family regulator